MKIVNLKTRSQRSPGAGADDPRGRLGAPEHVPDRREDREQGRGADAHVDATGGTYKPSAGAKTIPWNAPSWQVQDALGADARDRPQRDTTARRTCSSPARTAGPTHPLPGLARELPDPMPNINSRSSLPVSTGLTGGTSTATVTTRDRRQLREHDPRDRLDRRDPAGHAAAGGHHERRLRHDVDRVERPHRPRLAESEVLAGRLPSAR